MPYAVPGDEVPGEESAERAGSSGDADGGVRGERGDVLVVGAGDGGDPGEPGRVELLAPADQLGFARGDDRGQQFGERAVEVLAVEVRAVEVGEQDPAGVLRLCPIRRRRRGR